MEDQNEILKSFVLDIRRNHHKIIDDWMKAYAAQLYEEKGSIKPGDFRLVEQIDLVLENGKMGKKYWFELKE